VCSKDAQLTLSLIRKFSALVTIWEGFSEIGDKLSLFDYLDSALWFRLRGRESKATTRWCVWGRGESGATHTHTMRPWVGMVKRGMAHHGAGTGVKAIGLILASRWCPGQDRVNRAKEPSLVYAGLLWEH
jgi:hypothetical protein